MTRYVPLPFRLCALAISRLFLLPVVFVGLVTASTLRAQTPTSPPSSQTAPANPPAAPEPSRTTEAEQQIKQQESQRLLGVLPQFNISYVPNAVSLTSRQKFSLAFRTLIDPVTIAGAFVVAGIREANDDNPSFRWGPEGYMRRTGATYLDSFDSTIIGKAILPSVLHQDPRYFRLGHGSDTHRFLYALASNVIAKHDSTGRWEPNYSKIGGNFASGALSNLYYPARSAGVEQTFTNGLVVTLEGAVGPIFNEFWPDISRKFLHKDPTHGLDAQPSSSQPATPQSARPASR